jgi:hypothetical protein
MNVDVTSSVGEVDVIAGQAAAGQLQDVLPNKDILRIGRNI